MRHLWQSPTAVRFERFWRISQLASGLLLVLAVPLGHAFPMSMQVEVGWVQLALAAALLLSVGMSLNRTRRGRELVIACDFQVCPKCRYKLNGLPEMGQCPECGRGYSPDELRKTWIDAYELVEPGASPAR